MPQRLTDDELREAILLAEGGHWPAPPGRWLHQTVVALASDLLEVRAERDQLRAAIWAIAKAWTHYALPEWRGQGPVQAAIDAARALVLERPEAPS